MNFRRKVHKFYHGIVVLLKGQTQDAMATYRERVGVEYAKTALKTELYVVGFLFSAVFGFVALFKGIVILLIPEPKPHVDSKIIGFSQPILSGPPKGGPAAPQDERAPPQSKPLPTLAPAPPAPGATQKENHANSNLPNPSSDIRPDRLTRGNAKQYPIFLTTGSTDPANGIAVQRIKQTLQLNGYVVASTSDTSAITAIVTASLSVRPQGVKRTIEATLNIKASWNDRGVSCQNLEFDGNGQYVLYLREQIRTDSDDEKALNDAVNKYRLSSKLP